MKVAVIMGSDSDFGIMKPACEMLSEFKVDYDKKVISAHRTPHEMIEFASNADASFDIIIAGAGGAAHLPGMVASCTTIPVIGVPVKLKTLEGMDSLLSIVQMPGGVPVATVGINNSKNAALLAIRILSLKNEELKSKLLIYQNQIRKMSLSKEI